MNIIIHHNVTLSDVIKMIEEHRLIFFVSAHLDQDVFGKWILSSNPQIVNATTLSIGELRNNIEFFNSVPIELIMPTNGCVV